jgi:hypothetical protein
MKSTTIAVDLAKNVFQVAVSYHPGKVAETHRLRCGRHSRGHRHNLRLGNNF